MKRIVALADTLSTYREVLEEKGYHTVSLDEGLDIADIVLISGMDINHSGVSTIHTRAPVLDVTGKAPEEIANEIERHLGSF
ncbi:MAG: YkuS family protein [Firmicutes bacterium]|nr:YkuS family protein [Bacillota bacterium]HXL04523.1 YkuS family protein [Bacillota bacterium]